jgi:hypothetical protein
VYLNDQGAALVFSFHTFIKGYIMSTLLDCHKQWAVRPAEERFTSLHSMLAQLETQRAISRARTVSSRSLRAVPVEGNNANDWGLVIEGPSGGQLAPTNWAFNQAATLGGAPAGYLKGLPAPLAADCINWGLQVDRDIEDVQVLMTAGQDGQPAQLRAMTGPRYGRVWNADIVRALVDRFGDGRAGQWRVPGEFGRQVEITQDNTTLFAGDRDMFVFLADEENRIELPNRRDGQTGALARGFFVQNSEVGAATLRVKTFLFDYVCANRIVWGALELDEIKIRHTAGAPDKFLEIVQPALASYAQSSAANVEGALRDAQAAKLDKVDSFLANRFGPKIAQRIQAAHLADEGRPVETVWDAVTGATAYARDIPWTADRVDLEEKAGALLDLVG